MRQSYPLTLLYDGACSLCKLEIENMKARNDAQLLRFVDISAPGFQAGPYGVPLADMQTAIHAVTGDGRLVRGVEVFRLAYEAIGLGWLAAPTGWPVLKPFFDRAYVQLARHRYLIPKWFAWLLFAIPARRAARRSRKCKEGLCKR